ncbi:QWRF motif-containing protein 7-like [Aristolochia californica]|uniref:QWRF motif-containing protein 7-like n=1 Tax=Aristolochia californica TaxID=171875 RepID=UPI0035E2839C
MENSRRRFSFGTTRSPQIQKSRTETPAIRTALAPATPNSGRRSSTCSKTTTARLNKDNENRNPKVQESSPKSSDVFHSFRKLQAENRESLIGVSHYRQRISDSVPAWKQQMKVRSATTSPSAWALSPGRSPAIAPAKNYVEYSAAPKEKSGGGLSGVLRLFRQTKTSAAEKEAAHRVRLLYNGYLQWRFVNAQAEEVEVARKASAENKLLRVWTRVYQLRNSVVEKSIQVQKLKQEFKILHILNLQIPYLKDWEKVQKGNLESVTKLGRALRATSIKVPLVAGAKADVLSLYRALCMAMDVMNRIEATFSIFYFQVEKMNSFLNEIRRTKRREREGMEELTDRLIKVASLEGEERCLRTIVMHARQEDIVNYVPSLL